ncbi:hypothetical protein [Roseateles noduli]
MADYKVRQQLPSRVLSEQLKLAAEVIERCDRHDRGEGFFAAPSRMRP